MAPAGSTTEPISISAVHPGRSTGVAGKAGMAGSAVETRGPVSATSAVVAATTAMIAATAAVAAATTRTESTTTAVEAATTAVETPAAATAVAPAAAVRQRSPVGHRERGKGGAASQQRYGKLTRHI
jgi:hypothetical protein